MSLVDDDDDLDDDDLDDDGAGAPPPAPAPLVSGAISRGVDDALAGYRARLARDVAEQREASSVQF